MLKVCIRKYHVFYSFCIKSYYKIVLFYCLTYNLLHNGYEQHSELSSFLRISFNFFVKFYNETKKNDSNERYFVFVLVFRMYIII